MEVEKMRIKNRVTAVVITSLLIGMVAFGFSYNLEAASGRWKSNQKGWWYETYAGRYIANQWLSIDGRYYYFTADGYMDYSEYRDGCWLGSDGAWVEIYHGGHWVSDSRGWWYEDSSGWYPSNQWLWIDGKCYYFKSNGYLAVNETIQGSRVGADGAWIKTPAAASGTSGSNNGSSNNSLSSGGSSGNDYSGFNGGSTVYVSTKGKIHKNSNCGGMKNYRTMTYNEALNKGYKECQTCFK